MNNQKVLLVAVVVLSFITVSLCQKEEKKDEVVAATLATPTALFKCGEDQDLKDVEEYLETNDSVEDHANCVLENLPACSGGSSSKCCDNVGNKLKEIGLMVFGPRSSLKECGLLDQECRCQRRTAAKIARTFAVKFSSEYVLLQAHFKGSESAESSSSKTETSGKKN